MFSKTTRPDQSATRPDAARAVRNSVPSILSPDLRITGDLVCAGDIQIDGWIEGNVTGRNIHLGEHATVRGSLMGEMVRIGGTVEGEVRADNVVLEKTAHVTGDILHKSLAIEQGAFLDGRCKRIETRQVQVSSEKPTAEKSTAEKSTANKPATTFVPPSANGSGNGLHPADAV